jgi:hypothetical protein
VVPPGETLANVNCPDPFVCKNCPFVPSAVGSVSVKFAAKEVGACTVTVFVPLPVRSARIICPCVAAVPLAVNAPSPLMVMAMG